MPFIDNELYNADAVSDGLGGKPAPATLAKWRVAGDGPKFVRVGRTPLYRGSDITAWLASRTVSHTIATPAVRRRSHRKTHPVKPRRNANVTSEKSTTAAYANADARPTA
jgi:hypothetical protein